MQTFLPFESFERSARVLDDKRLGKQRVENLQIMKVLIGSPDTVVIDGIEEKREQKPPGWINHPAVKMWRGYEWSLALYQYAICWEWHIVRGNKDTCLRKTLDLFWVAPYLYADAVQPFWLGDPDFHRSHRSNLLRKDPEFYLTDDVVFERGLPSDLEYVWPVD